MANWSNPTLTSLYTDFVTEVKNRDVDLALGLDPATTSPTNVPTNAIRWNSANSRWEKYTSGSWGTLTATYALTALSLTGSITFEGATDDAFETTLTVADPTADRTITLPNVSGTVVTTGDTGSITSTMIADGTIVNADVSASAAIAGTKISPDFGSQNVTTTGTSTAAGFIPSSATVPSNGLYLPAANQLGFSTASTSRLVVDASGNLGLGVVPSAWSGLPALQISRANFTGDTASALITHNAYFNAGWKYINTSAQQATRYYQNAGQHVWETAPASTGNITFTQAMTLDASGRLGIGTTSPLATIDITGSGEPLRIQSTTASSNYITHKHNSSGDIAYLGAGGGAALGSGAATDYAIRANQGALLFGTNGNNERARIDSSGRLLVGATSTSANSTITCQGNSGTSTGEAWLRLNRGAITPANGDTLGALIFGDSTACDAAYVYAQRDGGTWSASSKPTRLVFSTTADGAASPTEELRITNDGVIAYNQIAPVAVDATATLTVANLKAGIITSTTAAAVTMTLPTGTLTEGGFSGAYNNMTFEWSVINTGATNAVTVQAGTDHTLVGSGTVAANNSGRFATRRTAANTWVTYRLSS